MDTHLSASESIASVLRPSNGPVVEQKGTMEELISAYLDGELSTADRSMVEKTIAESEQHRDFFEDLKALQEAIRSLPHYRLPADFHGRVLSGYATHFAGSGLVGGKPCGSH